MSARRARRNERAAGATALRLLPWLAGAALAAAPGAHAQPATASGAASATVVAPLSAVAARELDFGTVAVAVAQGGSVTVAPGTAGATYGGSARQACAAGAGCAQPHPAQFRVLGEGGRDYRISVPLALAAVPDSGAGPALAVTRLAVASASRPGGGQRGTLDSQGMDSFTIGGTIDIPAGTAANRYRAVVEVLLSYD